MIIKFSGRGQNLCAMQDIPNSTSQLNYKIEIKDMKNKIEDLLSDIEGLLSLDEGKVMDADNPSSCLPLLRSETWKERQQSVSGFRAPLLKNPIWIGVPSPSSIFSMVLSKSPVLCPTPPAPSGTLHIWHHPQSWYWHHVDWLFCEASLLSLP